MSSNNTNQNTGLNTDDTNRVSALKSVFTECVNSDAGVTLSEVRNLNLQQLSLWPQTIDAGARIAQELGFSDGAPRFGCSVVHKQSVMMRIEPLKFWVIGTNPLNCDAEEGATLDLSHSRTRLRIFGHHSMDVLNSFLPLDLRDRSFAVGQVASTGFHHVGVTLWRSTDGYELFVPRSFAVSLWEMLVEGSEQYGLAIEVS